MRGWRRALSSATVVVLGLNVAVVVLLGGEALLASRTGERLDDAVLDLDALIGAPVTGIEPTTVVWLGDSTAAGVGASGPATSVAQRVATAMAAADGRPVELIVLARSGARVDDVRDRQVPALAERGLRPDVVFVSVGANDATHLAGADRFRRTYGELLDEVKPLLAPGGRVVVLGVPDMGAIPRIAQPLRALLGLRGERLDDELRTLAAERGLRHVDLAAETGPAFRDSPSVNYAADDFHPSDAGYARWADAVVHALAAPAVEPASEG